MKAYKLYEAKYVEKGLLSRATMEVSIDCVCKVCRCVRGCVIERDVFTTHLSRDREGIPGFLERGQCWTTVSFSQTGRKWTQTDC